MALPPSALTQLLYTTNGSPEAAVGILDRFGCLSTKALASIDGVKACLEQPALNHAALFDRLGPGAVGPSLPDAFVDALKKSPFLSVKGKLWSESVVGGTSETRTSERISFWRAGYLSLGLPREFRLGAHLPASDRKELRTSVAETGSPSESFQPEFATQFSFKSPKSAARLRVRGLTGEEFTALLSTIELRGNAIE